MGLSDLLARLEQDTGTAGTAGVPADVPVNPLQTLGGTAGTSGTAENRNADAPCSDLAQHDGARQATPHERGELLALIAAIYADDTDEDRQEAIGAALADPDGALTCYRAIAAERGITMALPLRSIALVASIPATTGCKSCRHRRRPGLSGGYCGGERDDLPLAYGLHHPLRRLPGDQGVSCDRYQGAG